ncbi:hydrogenase maturation protease [Dichotomicrobium thermohalophilum]|uniref:Hydrogenase maturation protease n=1 Tax=Dichotomicrobium thermohalophilum TaxID=933063 RepID=A0A397Q6Q8_9HYPH|nr:hydrogenase maturation protease [Dichotomicrobium thermohalophilum]RIA56159.1 hydrogenase maturation protease [Dichotomicrobium thermohalophilum]
MDERRDILILGLGNRLMSDDAAGPLVIDRLAESGVAGARLCDGGTIGMALLPDIEASRALIAVDAAHFDSVPGTVRVFEGAEMDRQLGTKKFSAHDVALSDLIGAAAMRGTCPARRALVGVQPVQATLGTEPTPAVAAAIGEMAARVLELAARWRVEVEAA